MRKVRENITERLGLCLFIVMVSLSLLGSELSLKKASIFTESDPLKVSGRVIEVALPVSGSNDYRRIKLRLNRQTVISIGLNLNRLPAGSSAEDIQRGAIMTVSGIYSRGKTTQNPGGFSEKNWFRSEGISAKLTSAQLIALEPAARCYRPLQALDRFRLRSLELLEKSFAPQSAVAVPSAIRDLQLSTEGIMPALLMGHTGGMTAYTSKALSEAGAYHLVCVSGMHLMFFLLPFRKLSAWVSLNFRSKRRLLSAVVLIPALLSGFGHGINRATLLFLLASLDSRMQRRTDKINSLALAASFLLLLQPFAVRQRGFWMSFIAAGSLKCLSPQAENRLVNNLISSLGVFLILLPLTAKQQQGANLLAPFANIILIPMATYLTVVGFLILFLSFMFPFLSTQINLLAALLTDAVLRLWLKLIQLLANCRSTFLCYSQLVFAALLILTAVSIYLLYRSAYYKLALAALLLLLALSLFPWFSRQSEEQLDIIFLDVGQGDATLLFLPQGQTILIDGGDAGMGYQRILPALRSQGRDHVDLALITHGHSDHAVGVIELMSLGRIKSLLLPQLAEKRPADCSQVSAVAHNPFDPNEFDWMSYLLEFAAEEKIAVRHTVAGEQFSLDGVQISFIAPNAEDLYRNDDANNSSLVFYLDYYQHSILFTADMTKETEERLVLSEKLRPVDYLHVAHHGSRLTSGTEFLEQIQAAWAIISVGENNLYNHPHPDTLDRLSEQNAGIVRLDESAAFFLRLSEADSRIVLWQ